MSATLSAIAELLEAGAPASAVAVLARAAAGNGAAQPEASPPAPEPKRAPKPAKVSQDRRTKPNHQAKPKRSRRKKKGAGKAIPDERFPGEVSDLIRLAGTVQSAAAMAGSSRSSLTKWRDGGPATPPAMRRVRGALKRARRQAEERQAAEPQEDGETASG